MGDSVDVTARTFHTENGVAHEEGETYAVTDRAMAETLYGIGFVGVDGWTDAPAPPAAPVLASLTPATAVLGAPVTVQVMGSGFAATDSVLVSGAPVATVFISATELSASVDLTAAAAGDLPVSVRTAGAQVSNALTFTVTAAD